MKQEFEKKMMTQDSVKHKHPTLDPKEIGKRQATDEDYEELEQNKDQYKDQYNHGHLNPSSHHAGKRGRAVLRGLSCLSCAHSLRFTCVFSHVGTEHGPRNMYQRTQERRRLQTQDL